VQLRGGAACEGWVVECDVHLVHSVHLLLPHIHLQAGRREGQRRRRLKRDRCRRTRAVRCRWRVCAREREARRAGAHQRSGLLGRPGAASWAHVERAVRPNPLRDGVEGRPLALLDLPGTGPAPSCQGLAQPRHGRRKDPSLHLLLQTRGPGTSLVRSDCGFSCQAGEGRHVWLGPGEAPNTPTTVS
jgi:hypothetical protein